MSKHWLQKLYLNYLISHASIQLTNTRLNVIKGEGLKKMRREQFLVSNFFSSLLVSSNLWNVLWSWWNRCSLHRSMENHSYDNETSVNRYSVYSSTFNISIAIYKYIANIPKNDSELLTYNQFNKALSPYERFVFYSGTSSIYYLC